MGIGKLIISIIGIIFSIILVVTVSSNLINSNQEIQQLNAKLDNATEQYIDVCSKATSVMDLSGCKTDLSNIKTQCKDGGKYSVSVCSDPRIDAFITTYDSKLTYSEGIINNVTAKLIDSCVSLISSGGGSQECIPDMTKIQQDCSQYNIDNHMSVCSDPRINQILTGSIQSQLPTPTTPDLNQASQNPNSFIQTTNQNTLSFIDSCMKATDPYVMQTCSQTAKKILDYCNNISSEGIGQICSDPRLRQLANQNTNAVVQTTPSTTPAITTPICPASSTQNAIIIKGSTGNSLFSPQSLNLRGGDYVIFKSSDGKPHLLTSDNDSLRDWFLKNGALINNDQNVKLPITIFGNTENFLNVFDSYEPNISVTLDVKPTPTECSK